MSYNKRLTFLLAFILCAHLEAKTGEVVLEDVVIDKMQEKRTLLQESEIK